MTIQPFVYLHHVADLDVMSAVERVAATEVRDRQLEDWLNTNVTRTPWTAPTLLNTWANLGGAWQVAQFRRSMDMVQLRGVIAGGVIGTVALTLPAGFRPRADVAFPTTSNGAFGSMTIATNGNVTPTVGSAVAFVVHCQFSIL